MMFYATARTSFKYATSTDAAALQHYYLRNQDHLSRWEPHRSVGYHSFDAWTRRAKEQEAAAFAGRAYHFVVRCDAKDDIAAVCNFTNVVNGAFMACHLGYSIDQSLEGQGIIYEALQDIIPIVFAKSGLHRIMANYMPSNIRIGRLLARLGFEKEGYAKDYLKIARQWEDHILTSRINHTS